MSVSLASTSATASPANKLGRSGFAKSELIGDQGDGDPGHGFAPPDMIGRGRSPNHFGHSPLRGSPILIPHQSQLGQRHRKAGRVDRAGMTAPVPRLGPAIPLVALLANPDRVEPDHIPERLHGRAPEQVHGDGHRSVRRQSMQLRQREVQQMIVMQDEALRCVSRRAPQTTRTGSLSRPSGDKFACGYAAQLAGQFEAEVTPAP